MRLFMGTCGSGKSFFFIKLRISTLKTMDSVLSETLTREVDSQKWFVITFLVGTSGCGKAFLKVKVF